MSHSVYLDNAATTPVDPRVFDAMSVILRELYGNPSSLHGAGRAAARALDDARQSFAAGIGAAEPSEVVFTSGGTEADNTAVTGISRAVRRDRGRRYGKPEHLMSDFFLLKEGKFLTPEELSRHKFGPARRRRQQRRLIMTVSIYAIIGILILALLYLIGALGQ